MDTKGKLLVPARKMTIFLDADLENTFPYIKTAFFLDGDRNHRCSHSRKRPFSWTERTPFPMSDLFQRN